MGEHYGVVGNRHPRRLRGESLVPKYQRIVLLFTEGRSRTQIATLVRTSQWNVGHILRQCGVTREREIQVHDTIRAKAARARGKDRK